MIYIVMKSLMNHTQQSPSLTHREQQVRLQQSIKQHPLGSQHSGNLIFRQPFDRSLPRHIVRIENESKNRQSEELIENFASCFGTIADWFSSKKENQETIPNTNKQDTFMPYRRYGDTTMSSGTFPGTTMPGGTFPGTTMTSGTFPGTTMSSGIFPGTTMPSGTFPGTTMPGGTFPGTTMTSGTFPDTTMPGTTFPGGTFPDTTMSGTTFPGGTFPDTTMSGTTFPGGTFPSRTFPGRTFPDTTMTGRTFPGRTFPAGRFPDTTMPGTTFPDTTMPSTTMPDRVIASRRIPSRRIPDRRLPDRAISDRRLPDRAIPDRAIPDRRLPDRRLPDRVIPDRTIPDRTIPGRAIPERIPRRRRESVPGEAIGDDTPQFWLSEHNRVRADVGQKPVVWNDELAAAAKDYAKNCVTEHSDNNQRMYKGIITGENLAWGSEGIPISVLFKGWEDEKNQYQYPEPPSTQVGHYTQIVNKSVTEIGCGCADCPGQKFCVCRYNPIQIVGQPPY